MPQLTPYHLTFRSGLHVGDRGVNLEESAVGIPSDTLFAALLDTWNRLGGKVGDFVQPFGVDGGSFDPPFLLSSAFPFVGDVRFYPMPVDLTTLFSPSTLRERGKKLNNIRYFSEGLLRRVLEGNRLDDDLFPSDEHVQPVRGVALQNGSLWLLKDEVERLPEAMQFRTKDGVISRNNKRPLSALRHQRVWQAQKIPRVAVDRISSASNIFHAGRVTFAHGCGLWFGVWWRNNARVGDLSYQDVINRALSALQDDGLGGERTTGYGAFEYQTKNSIRFDDQSPARLVYLLSRYLPADKPADKELHQALAAQGAAYELVSVGGWLRTFDGAAQRRKRLTLVEAGGLVSLPAVPAGRIEDVRPTYKNPDGDLPHHVWRYGLALGLPWPVEEVKHA